MRLSIIDSALRDYAGHNFDYARLVAEAATSHGHSVRLIGSKTYAVPPDMTPVPVTPWFSMGLKDDAAASDRRLRASLARLPLAGSIGRTVLRLTRNAGLVLPPDVEAVQLAQATLRMDEYHRLWSDLPWTANDIGFAPNLTWPEALLIAEAAVEYPLPLARLIVLLRFDPPRSAPVMNRLQRAAERLGEKVAWFSDTESLATAYGAILQRAVAVAPIPIDEHAIERASAQAPAPGVQFGYFGEARQEKGFHLLPEAIECASSTDTAFMIQFVPGGGIRDPVIHRALTRLRRLSGMRVDIVEAALPTEALLAAMARCRVLLLPYASAAYRLRSSGLLCYALALGRVLIVPAGDNWLAHTVVAERAIDRTVLWHPDEPLSAAMQRAKDLASTTSMQRHVLATQAALSAPWLCT